MAGFSLVLVLASGGRAQSGGAGPAPKMAEEVFKNIQVLKGVRADQVNPIMDFFSASLGVECGYCHESERDKDDKATKLIARKMMQMTSAINKNAFDGRLEVTCYSCHRGAKDPVAIPLLSSQEPKPTGADAVGGTYPTGMPTVDQLLDKYVTVLGGASAIQRISSSVAKGTVTDDEGRKYPVEILTKAPAKRISVIHLTKGDSFKLYNGDTGWTRTPNEVANQESRGEGAVARDMRRYELDAARLEDPLSFAVQLKQVVSDVRVERTEKIADREAYVMSGRAQRLDPIELYFDKESGLLVRVVRYTDSPAGRVPLQIDYADYRSAHGVKMPFRWVVDQPRGEQPRFTYQVDKLQQNVPIEDSRFTVPASIRCPATRCSGPTDFNFGLPNPQRYEVVPLAR